MPVKGYFPQHAPSRQGQAPGGQAFPASRRVRQLGEPSVISWFKNHTCETQARWEILVADSAEAMVHYQVISLGHFEVTSLINVTAPGGYTI